MTPITFSDQMPTEEGLYLYRLTPVSKPLLIDVTLTEDGVYIFRINGDRWHYASQFFGQWSGKLEFTL